MSSMMSGLKGAISSMTHLVTGKLSKEFDAKDVVVVNQAESHFGAHLVGYLLHHKVKVRAACKSQEKADVLRHSFCGYAEAHDHLEIVVCADPCDAATCDAIMAGATYLMLTVSRNPGSFRGDAERDMVAPSLGGTRCLLESARKAGTVKRVCLISATYALGDATKAGQHFTADSWLNVTREEACKMTDVQHVFAACNALGEKEAWDWWRATGDKKPFQMSALLLSYIVGPELLPVGPRGANKFVVDALTGGDVHPLYGVGFVDARDVARAAAECLLDATCDGKRHVLEAGHYSYQDMYEWAKQVGDFQLNPAPSIATAKPPMEAANTYDSALTSFKIQYTPIEQSIKEMLKQVAVHQHHLKQQQQQQQQTGAATK
ncbi:uncharacterized protein PFL1_01752 [Pseudozyma flocculosa PF-1]|uniref:uncharacterized protein n=1 Tax=Pseudozyma flocculosa PF-1 TaxID=1277687 RepID=UPI0004560A40|nr:uncharacterized protein PFL1_01752 [Pseudozyma flocculosa PF-1]EPQ30855.1 hypothetical protein PFL1_01752 [Pseudozyma flocculosa PF-1]